MIDELSIIIPTLNEKNTCLNYYNLLPSKIIRENWKLLLLTANQKTTQ